MLQQSACIQKNTPSFICGMSQKCCYNPGCEWMWKGPKPEMGEAEVAGLK